MSYKSILTLVCAGLLIVAGKSPVIRNMVRENIVLPSNFIYPLFIHDEVGMTLIHAPDHLWPTDTLQQSCTAPVSAYLLRPPAKLFCIDQHH